MSSSREAILKRIEDSYVNAEDAPDTDVSDEFAPFEASQLMVALAPLPEELTTSPKEAPDQPDQFQEMIEIRPTLEPPPSGRLPSQTIALLWLFTMANCASNARNPLFAQPWRSLMDAAVVNPNRELGIALSYLFTSDIHDIAERLRLEGNGHAGKGLAVNIAKVLAGNLPVMAYGFGQGMLMSHFERQIEESPVWRVLASPYVSRIITALLSTIIYTGARKVISCLFPVPHYKFNQAPPLHWAQRIAGFGFRIYDATTSWEFYRISISQISDAPLHHPHFCLGAPVLDQVNVNIIQRLALNYHPYHDTYPLADSDDASENPDLEQEEPLLDELTADTHASSSALTPSLNAYEDSRSNVYSITHHPASCENLKVITWYSGRVAAVLAIAYTANLVGSLIVSDKEELHPQLRLTYTALIVLASTGAERIYEKVLPWVFRNVAAATSSCWSCLFTRARTQAAQVVDDEDDDIDLNDYASPGTRTL